MRSESGRAKPACRKMRARAASAGLGPATGVQGLRLLGFEDVGRDTTFVTQVPDEAAGT